MKKIVDYRPIVGDRVIRNIFSKASRLNGNRLIHINSTYAGGGVAEILNSLAPLMNDAGVDTDWRIIRGTPDLFNITKKFHNALQGDKMRLGKKNRELYLQVNEEFSTYAQLDQDFVIIHDPQPLPLIQFYRKRQPWVWRCHVDLSNPNGELWNFLKDFIIRYDRVIMSSEDYKKQDLPHEQHIFKPVIDPLSPKNAHLSNSEIERTLKHYQVPTDKPIILQISRFDKWKDPLGVIDVFKQVRKKVDCRLVLCGSMAADDPEGFKIFEKVDQRAEKLFERGDIILLTLESNILVNALQRAASVVLQKSLREGFGLTVTEALWKAKPVVASNVGGIPLQIEDGVNGFLVDPYDKNGCAERVIDILKKPEKYTDIAKAGKEYVRKNFLITRLVEDYLDLAIDILHI